MSAVRTPGCSKQQRFEAAVVFLQEMLPPVPHVVAISLLSNTNAGLVRSLKGDARAMPATLESKMALIIMD